MPNPNDHRDIFSSIELTGVEPKTPEQLVNLGLSVIDLARNDKMRRIHRISKDDPVTSMNGAFAYPSVSWDRTIAGRHVHMNITNRGSRDGLVVSAWAHLPESERDVVKVFLVNNTLAVHGLDRVINRGYPAGTAQAEIDIWRSNGQYWEMPGTIQVAQRIDYLKTLATIYHP